LLPLLSLSVTSSSSPAPPPTLIYTLSLHDALPISYVGRKQKKREFRQLWIARISAAVAPLGLNYSRFMYGLKKAGMEMNRKTLSEMAIQDPAAFAVLVETAKKAL